MCLLFVHLFGLLRISQVFEIRWLYDIIMDSYALSCIASRFVQVAIPYVLIAVTYHRVEICLIIFGITLLLRGLQFKAIMVGEMPNCTQYFYSKGLMATEFGLSTEFYYTDVVQQFINLFVSFLVLCLLNLLIVRKLKKSHRRARRQSASVSHTLELTCKFPKSQSIRRLDDQARREQKRVRFAIRTTVVIISSYLACNSINFFLYCFERFWQDVLYDENGQFHAGYVFISDVGTNLVVLASTIRIFIYYKYNPEIRKQIRSTIPLLTYMLTKKGRRKPNMKEPVVVMSVDCPETEPLQSIQFIDS
ncbi:unnamed protein product, partial [Mesorhabditis spiculigera]